MSRRPSPMATTTGPCGRRSTPAGHAIPRGSGTGPCRPSRHALRPVEEHPRGRRDARRDALRRFSYQVSRKKIVTPEDLSVLEPTMEPTLTPSPAILWGTLATRPALHRPGGPGPGRRGRRGDRRDSAVNTISPLAGQPAGSIRPRGCRRRSCPRAPRFDGRNRRCPGSASYSAPPVIAAPPSIPPSTSGTSARSPRRSARTRAAHQIDGPLFAGADTHALPRPALVTAVEVFAANGVHVVLSAGDEFTPTPAVSHAILVYNRGRTGGLGDDPVVTLSHNPPRDGGFRYNPPSGGPWIRPSPGGSRTRRTSISAGRCVT